MRDRGSASILDSFDTGHTEMTFSARARPSRSLTENRRGGLARADPGVWLI